MTSFQNDAETIQLLCEVAAVNGTMMTVKEVIPLLSQRMSEDDLSTFILSTPSLSTKLDLDSKSGYLKLRNREPRSPTAGDVAEQRAFARKNIALARSLAPVLGMGLSMIAVSGSASYESGASRDLDFFCVTRPGRMWLDTARLLVLSRIVSVSRPHSPQLCFGCLMDENRARYLFETQRDPLFARDALTTVVLEGGELYSKLVGTARWMSLMYPQLYKQREGGPSEGVGPTKGTPLGISVLNSMVFFMLGSFIRVKSAMRRRVVAREGRSGDSFIVKMGPDHLIFESARYVRLRKMYRESLLRVDGRSSSLAYQTS